MLKTALGQLRSRFLCYYRSRPNNNCYCCTKPNNKHYYCSAPNNQRYYCSSPNNRAEFERAVFSGIQPTGTTLHIGNYFGAVQKWLQLQQSREFHKIFISIVDLHAISIYKEPVVHQQLKKNVHAMLASLLACGLDPEKVTLFQQSSVPEHTTLFWILSSLTTLNQLYHMPNFKEKSKDFGQGQAPSTLFDYPILQAADILLYKATHVPVGDDQAPHMQIVRKLALHFNLLHKTDYFPVPEMLATGFNRIKSLQDPARKMSKSDPDVRSRLNLDDSSDTVVKKCKEAVVIGSIDDRVTFDLEKRPGLANLINIHCAVIDKSPAEIVEESKSLTIDEYKQKLADVLNAKFQPIRHDYVRLLDNPDYLDDVLEIGKRTASEKAQKHLEEIKSIVGMDTGNRRSARYYHSAPNKNIWHSHGYYQSAPNNNILFSGIQPTGALHIGNYFGAVEKWIQLQDRGEFSRIFVTIADLHAISVYKDADNQRLKNNIRAMLASLLACGLDPEKTVLFQQSSIPEHTELSWVLLALTTLNQLNHVTIFEQKSKEEFRKGEAPVSLQNYPVLQAADVLLYKAKRVQAGSDQTPHLQMMQKLAGDFNRIHKTNYFPIPETLENNPNRIIKSLREPNGEKMSKSNASFRSCVNLDDSLDIVVDKLKKALTDFTSQITYDPKNRPGVSNLIHIHSAVTGQSPTEIIQESTALTTAQYKLKVADVLNAKLDPIRRDYARLLDNVDYLDDVLEIGRRRASAVAVKHMDEIKSILGMSTYKKMTEDLNVAKN